MLNIIVQAVFDIISNISNAILYPLVSAVTQLLPNMTSHFMNIMDFFGLAFTYLACILRWLLFTPSMFVLLFAYFSTKFIIWTISAVVRVGIKCYNALKP